MKKLILPAIAITAASALMISSCGYEIPNSISITTKADYNFTVGSYNYNFSNYITVDTLTEKFNNNSNANTGTYKIYDYRPSTDKNQPQSYIAEVKLQEIPVDVSSYLSNLDISTQLASKSFNQDITIPELTVKDSTVTKELPDFNQIIKNAAKISVPDLTVPQGSATLPDLGYISASVSDPEFKTMKFSSGKLELALSAATSLPDDFSISAKVTLLDSSNNEISKSDTTTIFSKGVIEIPLTGKTITQQLKLKVTGTSNGGTTGNIATYQIVSTLSSDTKVSSVTGLKMDLGDSGNLSFTQNVSIKTDDSFVCCTIKDGSLTANAQIPSDWTGIIATPDVSITGGLTKGDGSSITESDFSKTEEKLPYILNRNLNLADYIYSKGDVKITGAIALKLDETNGADLNFESENNSSINIVTNCAITTVKDITIDTDKLSGMKDKLSFESSTSFPDSMKNYVKSIILEETGIKTVYSNNLPEGNDFEISIASQLFFGSTTPKTETIISGQTESKETVLSSKEERTITISDNPSIDYKFNLTLPGSTSEHPTYAVFNNVQIGSTYNINISIAPVFDWSQVTICTDSLSSKLKSTIDSNFNLNELFKNFASIFGDNDFCKKIELVEMPIYLYCSKPNLDVLNNLNFSGKIKLISGSDSDYKDVYILGDASSNAKLKFCATSEMTQDENKHVTSNLAVLENSLSQDIAEIINYSKNVENSKFKISYELQLLDQGDTENTITITKDQWESIKTTKTASSIIVTARIVLPLKIRFTSEADLDLNKIANIEEGTDIFKRTEKPDTSDYQKFLDVIKSMTINYKTTNQCFVYDNTSLTPHFLFDTAMTDLLKCTYDLPLDKGSCDIYFDDIDKIIKQYPFSPKMKVHMNQGTIFIPQDPYIEVLCSVGIKTDGTVQLF